MSIADEVKTYLKNKPYMIEALESKIANMSGLARKIATDLQMDSDSYNAIKAAIRRFSIELERKWTAIDAKAIRVLKGNSIMLLDKASVIISKEKLQLINIAEIEINKYHIYIVEEMPSALPKNSIIKIDKDCSVISVHSGSDIEDTAGFVAFITSVLAEQGINIVEFISCYTETMIIVNRIDAIRSYQAIESLINAVQKEPL
ncbi:MAG: ACT domain-containing protein [Candidatus Micrarchaeaceae archaeon]